MPTYEYECESCGHSFERFQPISARPVRVCPMCGRRKVRRLPGMGAGIIFRGSGFYATDYRNSSSGGRQGGNGDGEATRESKGSGDTTSSGKEE